MTDMTRTHQLSRFMNTIARGEPMCRGIRHMAWTMWLLLGAALAMSVAPAAHAGFDEAMADYRAGNAAAAFKQFLATAERGDNNAQAMVASMYLEGTGTTRDPRRALAWFEQAAAGGHSYAQYAVGLLYLSGQGVSRDPARGVTWLERSAQQGSYFAQTTLGDAYASGIGVAADKGRAASYFTSAAEQNYAAAQLKLASFYYLGLGVARDPVAAYKWAYLAAQQLTSAAPILQQFRNELPAEQVARGEVAARAWLSAKGISRSR
ncbi:sel1 repeat family protein [Reyranella sp. CPCC 100927]|nr:sel1 repeat family protein [Reyranella sp. CPCC 100927]